MPRRAVERVAVVLVLPRHHGFGCAVRAALRLLAPATSAAAAATRAHAPTPYVMVVQHDNNFVRGFPLADVLAAMRRDPAVLCKVDVLSSTTLRYADGAASKVSAHVKLEPYTYGGGVGRGSAAVVNGGGVEADGEGASGADDGVSLRLLPLLYWYDKTHVCRVAYYHSFVFGHTPAPAGHGQRVKMGDFIEDCVGRAQVSSQPLPPSNPYQPWCSCTMLCASLRCVVCRSRPCMPRLSLCSAHFSHLAHRSRAHL